MVKTTNIETIKTMKYRLLHLNENVLTLNGKWLAICLICFLRTVHNNNLAWVNLNTLAASFDVPSRGVTVCCFLHCF